MANTSTIRTGNVTFSRNLQDNITNPLQLHYYLPSDLNFSFNKEVSNVNLLDLIKELREMKNKINDLEKKVEELTIEVQYKPGSGTIYKKAEESFEKSQEQIVKNNEIKSLDED